jgi:transcriptional regulator with XRE-family HTH domain
VELCDRFGANLRSARKRTGLSQEELADLCAMYRTEVSLLERAGRAPRLGTLVKLASALDVSIESLCTGMRWDQNAQRFAVSPAPPPSKR